MTNFLGATWRLLACHSQTLVFLILDRLCSHGACHFVRELKNILGTKVIKTPILLMYRFSIILMLSVGLIVLSKVS